MSSKKESSWYTIWLCSLHFGEPPFARQIRLILDYTIFRRRKTTILIQRPTRKKKAYHPSLAAWFSLLSTVSVQNEWQLHHPQGSHIPPSRIQLPGSSEQTFPAKVHRVWSARRFCLVISPLSSSLTSILAKTTICLFHEVPDTCTNVEMDEVENAKII